MTLQITITPEDIVQMGKHCKRPISLDEAKAVMAKMSFQYEQAKLNDIRYKMLSKMLDKARMVTK